MKAKATKITMWATAIILAAGLLVILVVGGKYIEQSAQSPQSAVAVTNSYVNEHPDDRLLLDVAIKWSSVVVDDDDHYGGILRQYYVEDLRRIVPGIKSFNRETQSAIWCMGFTVNYIREDGKTLLVGGRQNESNALQLLVIDSDKAHNCHQIVFNDVPAK